MPGRLGPFTLPRRRERQLLVLSRRWPNHVLFVLGGILVGVVAVALAYGADLASRIFTALFAAAPTSVLLVTPMGFAACHWLAQRYFPNSGGSGIPQTIAARHLHGQKAREKLVSLRMAMGKILLLLLGLLCGASIGREGPSVQIGASILFAVGRFSPRRQPGLLLAGAGAGVAAAFNTPLAGIVFAIEEMSRAFESRTSGLVIAGVIAAGVTSLALQGDYTYFGTTQEALHGAQAWLAVPLIGVAGGLLGGSFSRILILFSNGVPGWIGRQIRSYPVLFAAACGLFVAICGLMSDGAVFGTGYAQARAMVQGESAIAPLVFAGWKLLATAASSICGIPGGFFAPSLAVGAGLGASIGHLLPSAPSQALVVLGMVAYFAGVVQAPITAFVIVAEMTNNHAMVMPLMLAALIGHGTSRLVCREGVYHALAHKFIGAAAQP